MRFQFHWQNPLAPTETILVAEKQFLGTDGFNEWVQGLCESRAAEAPEGWAPMVCDEDYIAFVKPAEPVLIQEVK